MRNGIKGALSTLPLLAAIGCGGGFVPLIDLLTSKLRAAP